MIDGWRTVASPFSPRFTIVLLNEMNQWIKGEAATCWKVLLVCESVGVAVSNGNAPNGADHLAKQLKYMGEGEVGDVDVVGAGVEVVEEGAQGDGQVCMS